ncbi:hypothetical protein K440DRAFT_666728 [Wilcoxina mikolae CBS 423.85]|nr:hypothetical protein K440DRAFT_666728 [Wilcoxina mikolae CBS 423.85]
MFTLPRRRAALEWLDYNVILPTYSINRISKYENTLEKEANNGAFALAVQRLFETLHSWGEQGRWISLELEVSSPMDPKYRNVGLSHSQKQSDLENRRFIRSILQSSFPSLPPVPRITRFRTPEYPQRQILPATILSIAAALPELIHVKWWLDDDEKKSSVLRLKQRYDFAKALPMLPTTLKTFSLCFEYNEPWNHGFTNTRLDPDYLTPALNIQLRSCPNLAEIQLSGPMVLDERIFDGEWPELETLDIQLNIVTPTGDWYTEGIESPMDSDSSDFDVESDDSFDSSDSYHSEVPDNYLPKREAWAVGKLPSRGFRNRLDQRFNKFLIEMGEAIKRMPKLKSLDFRANTSSDHSFFEAVFRTKLGETKFFERGWIVEVGKQLKWELTPEVRAVWEEAMEVGGEISVTYY